MEVFQGNRGDTSDIVPAWTRPSENSEEMSMFRQMGEINYIDEKRRQATGFTFLWLSSRRVLYTWTGLWSFTSSYLALESFEIPNIVFGSTLTTLMIVGLWLAWHSNREVAVSYAVVLIIYPTIYYITHLPMDCRHEIDPLIVVLAVHAVQMRKDQLLGTENKAATGASARRLKGLLRRRGVIYENH
jgi:hypothetical protein